MIKKILPVIMLLMTGFLYSCSNEKPQNIIDEETYLSLLVEIHILRAIDNNYGDENKRDELLDAIYEHYNITASEFEISHDYYQKDVDEQRLRLRKARDMMQDEFSRINTKAMETR